MGFFSSALFPTRLKCTSSDQASTSQLTKDESLFSDFDDTVSRLKAFDLEVEDEQDKECEHSSFLITGTHKYDVK